jgi:hypothetical protein
MKSIVSNLVEGELTSNTDWFHIQEVGQFLSPKGTDNLHNVIVKDGESVLATIKCTNSLYSEWLVACANSMWKTRPKVAKDIYGNTHYLGKMIGFNCEVSW